MHTAVAKQLSTRPSDLPPPEHYPHGARARYTAGCRCDDCRAANREYERGRVRARMRGDWNGLVDAKDSRAHLKKLSAQGVGRRAVHAATGVSNTVLSDILTGRKTRVRSRTMRDILAVDAGALSDGAQVPAKETWRMLREILKAGYTKGEVAQALGCKVPALQIRKDKVLLRTEHKVKKLLQKVKEMLVLEQAIPEICTQCGYSHDKSNRLAVLRRLLPLKFEDIKEAWPCFYGSIAGDRQLYRDLHNLGAENDEYAVWSVTTLKETKHNESLHFNSNS